ncbi:MAG TPA: SIS domain-containing protein [Patescibacteria group bacterium]|nr:SIS domain-containing protein [Patescibacteria group bacterium]
MSILDDRDEIKKLDTNNGLRSIEELGSQIKQAWDETRGIKFPETYKIVKNVVVAGMGGSAYGTHVIQTLFKDELKVPVFSVPDYTLPAWVNSETLVVLSSYSGNTEETLSAGEDAKKKGAQITGLASGGKLADFLKTNNYPGYIYTATFNPCNVPRYALGYSVFGQIALLERTGLLSLSRTDFEEVLQVVAQVQLENNVEIAQDKNLAKLLAFESVERLPIITAAEHLEGASHVVANAFNETAKVYSEYRVVPEMNHHLMEGLAFPKSNDVNLLFLLVNSSLYAVGNSKRMKLTAQVIEQNKCESRELVLKSKTKLSQVFELMAFGAYTTFYLALLNGQNPTPNLWVDWFKAELKK